MGGPSGFPSAQAHLRRIQRGVYFPINPVRRARDHAVVTERTLWNGRDVGPEGLLGVGFQVGRFGRMEWTAADGEELYVQYFAPSLDDQTSPPERMIAAMDYAGVDLAVLQNDAIYGLLNDFLADCDRRYPDRLIGLGHVLEAEAHTDAQMAELHRCAEELGHRGLFYQVSGFWETGYRAHIDDATYAPFWDEVARLGLVVFWHLGGVAMPSAEADAEEMGRVLRVMARHPQMPAVLVQALPPGYYARQGRYALPAVVGELARLPRFSFELTFPISYGHLYAYPYRELWPLVRQLHDELGPDRLVWGSDAPNVERFCTYRQSWDYLRQCGLPAPDLELLLGGNLARLFGLQSATR
jgi:predicted TIM-barrel fold metal-dependent hydrolase